MDQQPKRLKRDLRAAAEEEEELLSTIDSQYDIVIFVDTHGGLNCQPIAAAQVGTFHTLDRERKSYTISGDAYNVHHPPEGKHVTFLQGAPHR